MDINNTFLQADLHEEVYVTQPEGFINPDKPHHIFCLKRALYGLKQAPLTWNHTLDSFLIKISFTTATTNLCLYTLHNHSAVSNSKDIIYKPDLHCIFVQSTIIIKPLVILSVYVDDLLIVSLPNDVDTVKDLLRNHFHIKDFGLVSMILSMDISYDITMWFGALLYITLVMCPDVLHAVVYLSWFVCMFNNTHFKAAWHVL
ncbi:RNA-dependent DNA polymerase, putative [Acanthamoeba castellanii str. Neff]|uniref:RNA-dependent DNA polymerase, putative n=1 Tax=Acanthamoeba castellanii (strain ATCC 30010 / Neff) TaxID=1257118 RepID=L8HA10_ACACF|nr:RNA-dependent DNA polymerase, putative [Acanthamoeba castellanii str. Neff]ELR22025.1 RNA-dependent DNA polymerase, putative [Acanthamoeba castellanii str. Neff]